MAEKIRKEGSGGRRPGAGRKKGPEKSRVVLYLPADLAEEINSWHDKHERVEKILKRHRDVQ